MPVEIKELHIKVVVNQTQNTDDTSGNTPAPTLPAIDQEALIAECVEQVLEILKSKKER